MSNPSEREHKLIWKAGIFVGLGLLLAGLVIFLLGKERGFFGDKISYRAAFVSVDGLQVDSPVRLGGLSVGRVKVIEFSDNLYDTRVFIELEVQKTYSNRIREDSVVRIASRGVLGDKAIDISVGSTDKPVARHKAFLETGSSGDITTLLDRAGEIVDNVVDITRGVKGGVDIYADPTFAKNIAETIDSLRAVLSGIQLGPGALHTLVFDKQSGKETQALLQRLSSSAAKLDKALGNADALISEVRQSEGLVGALLHDKKMNVAFQSLGDAAENLKEIISKVHAGEGSLGAIINDPSVYEDLKEILGNIKRNRLLRELVRLSISNSENFEKLGETPPTQK